MHKLTLAQAPSPFSTTSVIAHLPASAAPLSTFSITIFGVKVVATLKILKLNDLPACLSSQTLLDLLKICSLVCSAGNM